MICGLILRCGHQAKHLFHLRDWISRKPLLPLQIRKLKLQLEEEQQKCSRNDGTAGDLAGLQNGSDLQLIEMQSKAGAGPPLTRVGLCPGSGCEQAVRACSSEDWLVLSWTRKAILVSHGTEEVSTRLCASWGDKA